MLRRRPILYPFIPGCRDPSREQTREHRGSGPVRVADACGAPVLRDHGSIGRLGKADKGLGVLQLGEPFSM